MITGFPFWLSAGHSTFKTSGGFSAALAKAGIPAPRWCSEIIGKDYAEWFTLPSGEHHGIDVNNYVNWQDGVIHHINVPSDATYVGPNTSTPALTVVPPTNIPVAKVVLHIQSGARIYGRGGNGASISVPTSVQGSSSTNPGGSAATSGGPALRIKTGITLNNSGSVFGGGGGGASAWSTRQERYTSGGDSDYRFYFGASAGGGGAPYGAGGSASGYYRGNGNGASLTGSGSSPAVSTGGGNVSQGGSGGAPGYSGNGRAQGNSGPGAAANGAHFQWV